MQVRDGWCDSIYLDLKTSFDKISLTSIFSGYLKMYKDER